MPHPTPHNRNDRLVRISDVEMLTGLRRSRIYELMHQHSFPRQIKIVGSAHWSFDEIQQWIADRKAERDHQAA